MKRKLKILLVDDHPLILEAYVNILKSIEQAESNFSLTIDTANDCDSAIQLIDHASKNQHYDMLFTDVKLPPSKEGAIISGEDLGIYMKQEIPNARVVILTMINENYRIHNILNNVNPDGFLIKNDVTSKEFQIAFEKILDDPPYYSSTVSKFFRKRTLIRSESSLDAINRKILFYLSQGVKTKDLCKYINLSQSAIEKRKNQIKNVFELEKSNDEELLKVAEERGYI